MTNFESNGQDRCKNCGHYEANHVDTFCVAVQAATTALGQREEEARRIARAEGFPIVYAEADWTFFTLGDSQYIEDGLMAGRTIHTHFSWESGRFEGFVS